MFSHHRIQMPRFGIAHVINASTDFFIQNLNTYTIDACEFALAMGSHPLKISTNVLLECNRLNVRASVHMPFWTNLENVNAINERELINAFKLADKIGYIATMHLGYYAGQKFDNLKHTIVHQILYALKSVNPTRGCIGLETSGKQKSIGKISEIVEIMREINDQHVTIVIDWAHLYARNRGLKPRTIEHFEEILRNAEIKLGYLPYHFHGGGIIHNNGNELAHTSVIEMHPPLPFLFQALKNIGHEDFTMIVESPTNISDIALVRKMWSNPEQYFNEAQAKQVKTLF